MATEAWILEKATIGEGDEVANSLADRMLTLQADVTAIDGETGDIAAIKAVTDALPDAGALTVPVADAATNVNWGDVIGNKEDIASTTADVASLMALIRKTLEEALELARHVHGRNRWWGAVAVPDETNAIDANVNRPFAATSGANTWGAAIPICGTSDNPAPLGTDTKFDANEVLITDLDDDTSPWRLRFIWGMGNSADAITANDWSEVRVQSNAVPGNRAGGSPAKKMMPRIDVGSKMWAQSWNETVGEILSFFYDAHGYPN